MKKVIKLFIILIILSMGLYSCLPLYPYGYGNQGHRDRGNRNYGYSDQGHRGRHERHQRNNDRYSDRGDPNYNSRHE